MNISLQLQQFTINDHPLALFVPEEVSASDGEVQNQLYWAKLWPAAIGMVMFLEQNKNFIRDKWVLEIGAGLGLPGLFAATSAKHVHITDADARAVAIIEKSRNHLALQNASTGLFNWKDLYEFNAAEVILFSDVNYDPMEFPTLLELITMLLHKNCTIILSTPQRLMAKEFIIRLMPACILQEEQKVELNNNTTYTNVFVFASH